MKKSQTKKISAIWTLILAGLFMLFKNWLSTEEALILTTIIPFLYFIPGFFVTKVGFSSLDRLETISLAMLFSLILSHVGIYALEENTRQMTTVDIAFVIAIINIFCALAYFAHRKHLSPTRLLARLRNKLHKRDQKQP